MGYINSIPIYSDDKSIQVNINDYHTNVWSLILKKSYIMHNFIQYSDSTNILSS